MAELYQLPLRLLMLIAVANVVYGCCSFTLALRSFPGRRYIQALALANIGWAMACLYWAYSYFGAASVWGLMHLLAEAVVVGGLGCLEWREQRSGLLRDRRAVSGRGAGEAA